MDWLHVYRAKVLHFALLFLRSALLLILRSADIVVKIPRLVVQTAGSIVLTRFISIFGDYLLDYL